MKETLLNIWKILRDSSASARMVVGAGTLLALIVAGASMYRSANPHMEFFIGDLDNTQFSRATRALSQSGVRFETSVGGAPYTVFVEAGEKYAAHNALADAGAMDVGSLGIDTSDTSSAWDSSVERLQKADARYWQEVEKQLAQLHWIRSADVIAKQPTNRTLGRAANPTVSVILTTRGMRPTTDQSQNVGNIVRTAFNVPEENITILDHTGALIFDGKSDNRLNDNLSFQRSFDQDQTETVQQLLDDIYGPGLTRVTVRGDWSFVKTETVGEQLGPEKRVLQETTSKSSTPTPSREGGPAGLEESFAQTPEGAVGKVPDPATTNDTDKQYAYGTQTTHRVEDSPSLNQLSVSLTLDASLEDQAIAVTEQVKAAVGFQRERGDQIATHTTALNGIERDEEGIPVEAAPIVAPEAPNAMMGILIERGVEIVALLVFVILLLRSLRSAKKAANGSYAGGSKSNQQAGSVSAADVDIDPSLLARMHIENLLESDPDRVSSLLSRWAMGEDFYAKAKQ